MMGGLWWDHPIVQGWIDEGSVAPPIHLGCDRYVAADVPAGSLDFPWPIEENRCVLSRGHDGDHLTADWRTG